MAINGAVRWRPDVYRSALETTIQGFNPTGETMDPATGNVTTTGQPGGQIVMTAQLVAYDSAAFTGANGTNPYRPGNPATEERLVVLYEEPIMKDLAAFASMTDAQAQAEWQGALIAFRDRVLPVAPLLVKAIRAARMAPPVVLS